MSLDETVSSGHSGESPLIDLGTMPAAMPAEPRRRRFRPVLVGVALAAALAVGYVMHPDPATPDTSPAVPAGCERAIGVADRYVGAWEAAGPYVEGLLDELAREYRDARQYCPITSE